MWLGSRSAFVWFGGRGSRAGLLPLLTLCALAHTAFAQAQALPQRLLIRDVARYLALTPEQQSTLNSVNGTWSMFLAEQTSRVQSMKATVQKEAGGKRDSRLDAICQQSTERFAKLQLDTRAVLKPAQLGKLGVLEDAFALLPILESAQSANLLPSAMTAPPAGMPGGNIDIKFSYARVPVVALPGCEIKSQKIQPGTDNSQSVSAINPPSSSSAVPKQ